MQKNQKQLPKVFELELYDTNRHTSDHSSVTLALTPTFQGYSIGLHINCQQVGLASYVQYWHYDEDELSIAQSTFDRVKKICTEIVEDLEFQRAPFAIIGPQFRTALVAVDRGHKEKSGVYHYNWYEADYNKEPDWRLTLYGPRYPKTEKSVIGEFWGNQDEQGKEIEVRGTLPRHHYYHYTTKLAHIQPAPQGLVVSLDLGRGFLLWLGTKLGLSHEQIIQKLKDDPQIFINAATPDLIEHFLSLSSDIDQEIMPAKSLPVVPEHMRKRIPHPTPNMIDLSKQVEVFSEVRRAIQKVGHHWGAVAEELKKKGVDAAEMPVYNASFLRSINL